MGIRLIEDWRQAWKLHSVRVFALILLFPDLYSGIAAMGWLEQAPPVFMWSVRALGAIGVVARVLSQRNIKKPGEG